MTSIPVRPSICTFGYHDRTSPRYWTICRYIEGQGGTLRECHTDVRGFVGKMRALRAQWKTMKSDCDTVLVTFPGHYLVPLAWLLTRRPRKTLLFDAFVSLYDSNVSDRRLFSPWHPRAWMAFLMDIVSCHLADRVLVDTQAQKEFFCRRFRLSPERVEVVYLRAREDLFKPPAQQRSAHAAFDVFFYGSYIPLQGIETILRAAAIVQKNNGHIRFMLVGGGQTQAEMRALSQALQLQNVTFRPPVGIEELPSLIRDADLCLGIFGTSDKALRVIPHKVYDAVACGVPVVTADTPAIRERFASHPLVSLCPPGDPAALANAILERAHRSAMKRPSDGQNRSSHRQ
ncbi:MAG: glycosyltransferase [Candidatus Peribacteraceae bacterium]|nr:glycosyltransferase [Candidatus Peribacteraceae bacterium]